ncbi:MAG: branched-chain amino acid transport system II carrier protein [Erysipelothrix sp.]|nr:branched-chain amino acid transport system II carrier protein [Erysipelothrix sp.]
MKNRFIHRLVLASLLFGLFFGAGNLIFPISIGQNSGASTPLSILGFIVSGVGLACLAVIFTAKSKKASLEESLQPYGKVYARVFTILLLLTIGPLFALPRTATVPYEVSIRLIVPGLDHNLGLFIYSLLFFSLATYLALKPEKIKGLVGVFINPMFLTMLGIFFVVFIINPMGPYDSTVATQIYKGAPFTVGFQDGYQTMDVLAAMMFGFVVIHANDKQGEPHDHFKDIIHASVYAGILMLIIYTLLSFMGASSAGILEIAPNGGLAFGEIFVHYFGKVGLGFFGILISLACLKTAIGLIVSSSTYFSTIIPKLTYSKMVFITSFSAFVISNFGLSAIIEYAIPVLNFIYPLAIVHVFVGLFLKDWENKQSILNFVLSFSILASILEVLKTMSMFKDTKFFIFYTKSLPLSNYGISWVNISVLGFILGLIYYKFTQNEQVSH